MPVTFALCLGYKMVFTCTYVSVNVFLYTEGNPGHDRVFELVANELSVIYPGHILSKEKREWLFVNCGGWMGAFLVLHASITEYVLLFGTGIHTSGNSGTYNLY